MAGATAAAATAAPHAHAQTAQISLINNQIDSISGDNLSLEITAGHPFGASANAAANAAGASLHVVVDPNSYPVALRASAVHVGPFFIASIAATQTVQKVGSAAPQDAFALIPITLTDPNVNNGLFDTNALLEVEAMDISSTDFSISLLDLYYTVGSTDQPDLSIDSTTGDITGSFSNVGSADDGTYTSAVPEPTTLGLLAMGAGGILALRRRRKMTAEL
jgi:hypothetical protein